MTKVVIIGAGFGGLWAARTLAHSPVDVLLVDRNNYHTFSPLLYQVGAAELEPENIAYPVRSILKKWPNVHFDMAEVQRVDLAAQTVTTADRTSHYDHLIFAIGSTYNFFGVPGAAEYAFPLKTLEQAIALRNHVLRCFEQATREADALRRQQILSFIIVGGGPTGVEFAGALAELVCGPLVRDFPTLDFSQAHVMLFEAAESLLVGQPKPLGDYAQKRLRHMGVDVRLQAAVSQVTPQAVRLKDGTLIPAETVIWTAGVRGVPEAAAWGLPATRNGQITVLPTLQVPGHPEVYVVGDLARIEEEPPLPLVAPVAIQQGAAAARNIVRQINGQAPTPFRYHDRGTLATIGRNAAVAYLQGHPFTGFLAWGLWLGVHIFNLIGFRNRFIVLINWAWDYIFYERGVRLILPAMEPPSEPVATTETQSAPTEGDGVLSPTSPSVELGGQSAR